MNGFDIEGVPHDDDLHLPTEVETELDDLSSLLRGGIGHLLPSVPDVFLPSTVDDVDPLATEAGEEYAALVASHARPAWIPRAHLGEEDEPVSKYFGAPWTADGVDWPRLGGRDAVFVLQIDLASLPSGCPKVLGGRGLLQVFAADPEAPGPTGAWIVRLARPHLRRGRNRVGPVPWGARPHVVDAWEERSDVPDPAEAVLLGTDPDEIARIAEKHGAEPGSLGSLRGDKLRGWPSGRSRLASGEDAGRLSFYQMDAGRPPVVAGAAFVLRGMLPGMGRAHLLVDPKGAKEPVVRTVPSP